MTNEKEYGIFKLKCKRFNFMDEKRKYPRVNVPFSIACKPLPARSYFHTVCKDLSFGGARIISNDFISTKDFLKVDINLIDRVINVKAKVAWCSKERISDRYSAGLKFLEMNKIDQANLLNFLNEANH
ncbi:MAG: PilZ domain-containing protein [Candidatus Omnitrophota bacterium]